MNGPAQTPMVLVKAGAVEKWSDECKKALVQCGYDPDAFGSYDNVKAKIDAAKAKREKWDSTPPNERKPQDEPTPDEAFLSQCQAGHLSQDALFRAQKGRDSPCDNHRPGSDGNVTGLAPCMPHFGDSNKVGSTHQRITVAEPQSAKNFGKAGTDLDDTQVAACAGNTINIALDGTKATTGTSPTTPSEPLLAQAEQLQKQRETEQRAQAKQTMEAERAARQAGSAAAQQESAAALQAKHGVDPAKDQVERDEAQKKAAECIEAFRKEGMDDMREQVIEQNSTKNKQAAQSQAAAKKQAAEAEQKKQQQKADDARDRQAQAESEAKKKQDELDADGPLKRDAKAQQLRQERDAASNQAKVAGAQARSADAAANAAGRDAEKAGKEEAEANRRLKEPTPDEACLQSQADALEKQLPNLPPMTGKVPGAAPGQNTTAAPTQNDESLD